MRHLYRWVVTLKMQAARLSLARRRKSNEYFSQHSECHMNYYVCVFFFPSRLVSTNLHLTRTSWGQGLVPFSLAIPPAPRPWSQGLAWPPAWPSVKIHTNMGRCPQVSKLPAHPDLLLFPKPLLAYSFGTLRFFSRDS